MIVPTFAQRNRLNSFIVGAPVFRMTGCRDSMPNPRTASFELCAWSKPPGVSYRWRICVLRGFRRSDFNAGSAMRIAPEGA